MKWNAVLLSAMFALTATAGEQGRLDSSIPSDAEIRTILADRIDNQRQSLGIVVGIIEPRGRRIVACGMFDKNDKRLLDGDTIFEIGAITKVFTALLLADMAQHHEVALAPLGLPLARFCSVAA